jgi:hypothetical protein
MAATTMTGEPTWLARNVCRIRFDFDKPGQEHWVLLTSDCHTDNAKADRRMFKRHLDRAVARKACWADNGDLMCLMQGKYDHRSSQSELLAAHRGHDYLDRVSDWMVDMLRPYAANAIAFGHGNHETGVIDRCGVDMTERLCDNLRKEGSHVRNHFYEGWLIFDCRRGRQRKAVRLHRFHGKGGESGKTKGTTNVVYRASMYPDADILLTGHIHQDWAITHARDRITNQGRQYQDDQLHVNISGYKGKTYTGTGWETLQGHAVKPKTAGWLRFFMEDGDFKYEYVRSA